MRGSGLAEEAMTLTVGGLFSGIGGLELGLERAGMKTVFQVEQNEYCRKVLAKHWPDVQRFIDVRDVGAHNLPPVDLICGGFPCQDISYAGRGAGLSGERSGLWHEYARIVREMGPRGSCSWRTSQLCLVEDFGDVLGTLADCGYDAEWSCIQAADMGAPHLRDRAFVLAYRPGFAMEGSPLDRSRPFVGLPGKSRRVGADARGPFAQWQTNQPRLVGVDNGVSDWVEFARALGNAVVPQVAEFIGRLIVEADAARTEDAA